MDYIIGVGHVLLSDPSTNYFLDERPQRDGTYIYPSYAVRPLSTCFTLVFKFHFHSSVSSTYFNLAVHMREYLGKQSCTSSTFPIAIQN